MARFLTLVALAAVITVSTHLGAQALSSGTLKDPPWLLLELGKKAFREKNFGQALDYFRTSIARGGTTPEAEMWIGRVFEEEGELDLAENQYQRALSNASQFQIPAEATTIRYDLARIYSNTNQYGKYEVTLKKIVSLDKEFVDPQEAFTRQSMIRVLTNDGLNKLIVLYRLRNRETLQAHSDLGELYYKTGRYADAALNLTFSVVTILTVAIDSLKNQNPDFQFSTVDKLFLTASGDSRVNDYLRSTHLFRDLYYLASSLYAEGHRERAVALWRLVMRQSPMDTWHLRSAAQIDSPHIEPIININP